VLQFVRIYWDNYSLMAWVDTIREIWNHTNNNEFTILYLSRTTFEHTLSGADPGFQVRGGTLKKIVPNGGRRENFGGISCVKSRFYAKK
jgi:hypothetical protein